MMQPKTFKCSKNIEWSKTIKWFKNCLQFITDVLRRMFHSKMRFFFEMCFCFQNVKGFISVVFPFSEKHDCKQKFVNKDSFTGEVVKQQRNIHKAFKFVFVFKNL